MLTIINRAVAFLIEAPAPYLTQSVKRIIIQLINLKGDKMKRKRFIVLSALIAVVVLAPGLSACGDNHKSNGKPNTDVVAEVFTEGLEYTEIYSDDGKVVSYSVSGLGTATDSEIIIPSVHNGKPVTAIDRFAFDGYSESKDFTGVTIPDSVKSIGEYAFRYCQKLTDITIGNGVRSIGICPFEGTAYYEDESNWEDDVLYVGKYLINARGEFLGNYEIKHGTLAIADRALLWWPDLTGVTLPDGLVSIGESAFEGCNKITEIVIPDSVTCIGNSAFASCSSLTDLTLGAGLTDIGFYAFGGCGSLTSVSFPDGVISIGERAFIDCGNLASITISDSVKSIGWGAFEDTAYYDEESNWANGVLYIGRHLIRARESISGSYEIKSGTLTIAVEAFKDCNRLTGVIVPDSVTDISASVFCNCSKLKSVTLPETIKSIGNRAFMGCTDLSELSIGLSIESIGEEVFCYCDSLTDIYFNGTILEWEKVEKSRAWDYNFFNFTVHCTNGGFKK